ncbi:nicotinate phosphoribosyltransferase [Azospirillum formosense]|uniref:Nicotinate phosphoribosyltransferase n=1 Tax=Azospirillum formosense TaxID=861533 RepID=A0ABX2KYV5_9PROT|nr:nicotinate phosphoribosyltransferase [Azospirillum formosense]MBY3755873.1 nicotinate phosphoribosyltransferase [Azospirillum formosense]NUB19036.1 nicotinate phosphoribosyltransferase [Azospirillum formosense]
MPESDGDGNSLLLTDYYQLAMVQAYVEHGLTDVASFELFVRKLPPGRNFLMAAGLEQAVEFLESARFGADEIAWLRGEGRFSEAAVEALANFKFSGDVDALPEGTVFFAHEPILRVTAPLPQAQLVESRLINLIHLQTVIASKAARLVLAARHRPLIDFGLRRAHGAEAALLAARASYLAGFAGTATALAAMRFGIPAVGTMAHSFIQAHASEREAFANFARSRPRQLVLLLDTHDTEAAARTVVALAGELAGEGLRIDGVRLDSGDLAALSRKVRGILDEGGLAGTRIIASGGLDEPEIADLLDGGAPIDSFGVGTSLGTSSDAPALDCAYKLVEYAGLPRRKRSAGKATWPGRKQVFRRYGPEGRIEADRLSTLDSDEEGRPLLVPVMRGGRRVAPLPDLPAIRAHAAAELASLPEALSHRTSGPPLLVEIAPVLERLAREADRRVDTA